MSESGKPLVIVGGCSSQSYEKALANAVKRPGKVGRIIMTGPIYNQEHLIHLRRGCIAYIHGHSVGGTNPSLLEAMSVGNTILSHDNVFNREVCLETAIYFKTAVDLSNLMHDVEKKPMDFKEFGTKARERVKTFYRWDDVVTRHEELLREGKL